MKVYSSEYKTASEIDSLPYFSLLLFIRILLCVNQDKSREQKILTLTTILSSEKKKNREKYTDGMKDYQLSA